VKKLNMKFKTGFASLVVGFGLAAGASMAQTVVEEWVQLRHPRLDHPLVQQKYLNDPELLRFLSGTYAEFCTRAFLIGATKHTKANVDHRFRADTVKAASQILELSTIWEMAFKELESVFGNLYVHSTYFCDCMIKELTDVDLVVNPAKGVEIVNALPVSTAAACEMLAEEKAEWYKKNFLGESR